MIKIFRKIRRKLLIENNFSKYLLYAIGEIVLVVIGILIAVSINNANEIRKNENEINSTLGQVRSELFTSIKEAEDIMKQYMKQDSLIHIVMRNNVTYDDYKESKISGLVSLCQYYMELEIQKDGYLNLMNYVKNSPKGLDTLITDLKRVYVNDLENVDGSNTIVKNTVSKFIEWLKLNTRIIVDYYYSDRTLTDEQIDFYLNSDYYESVIAEYYAMGIRTHYRHLDEFRHHANNCANKITTYLNVVEDLSAEPSTLDQKTEVYKHYIGSFKSSTDTIVIAAKNKALVFQNSARSGKYSIIPVNKGSFIAALNYFYYLKFDERGSVVGMTGRVGDNFREYVKMQ